MSEPEEPAVGDKLSALCARWMSYLFLGAVVITGYEVVARYLFNAPSIWVHEAVVMMVGVNFAVGGVFVLREKAHIAITALYDAVPACLRRLFDVVIALVSLLYLGALTYAAWVIARQAWRLGETSGTAWNPPLPIVIKTALLFSAVVMALIAVRQLFTALRRPKE